MIGEPISPGALVERLKALKEQRQLSWDEIARRIGVTTGAIRQWKLGLIKHVRPEVLRRIAEVESSDELGNPVSELNPQGRNTLRRARRSVERILLSGNRSAIEHLKSTLEVLQNYVEADGKPHSEEKVHKAGKSPKGDREAD